MNPEEKVDALAEGHRFLTPDRVTAIGELIAPLLQSDMSWIERRKESVDLLDDRTLRRGISVDFSLRSRTTEPLLSPEGEEKRALYCAPVFILPKSSGSQMAFDFTDEENTALHLISRTDNARVSAEALVCMARAVLSSGDCTLSDGLADRLRQLAMADPGVGQHAATRLLEGRLDPWSTELECLRADPRLCWWLKTLAHSSIVVVLYRALTLRRKMVKLSFEEPIRSEQRLATRLGWAAYRVVVDVSLIEARSFHFEAIAPPGLKITEARLSDNEQDEPVREEGFLRRVHLYRPGAEGAGAGTAVLWLTVSGPGFIGGAWIASLLTLGALGACAIWAENIAANPTSAPALLLILPGLIASYIARPDQHALTTRLLSGARRLLMFSAFLAYLAAGRVALSGGTPKTLDEVEARADSLETWLTWLAAFAFLSSAALGISFLRGRINLGGIRDYWSPKRFRDSKCLPVQQYAVYEHIRSRATPAVVDDKHELYEQDPPGRVRFVRTTWYGTVIVTWEIEDADGDSVVSVVTDYLSGFAGSVLRPLILRRKAKRASASLNELDAWARAGT